MGVRGRFRRGGGGLGVGVVWVGGGFELEGFWCLLECGLQFILRVLRFGLCCPKVESF